MIALTCLVPGCQLQPRPSGLRRGYGDYRIVCRCGYRGKWWPTKHQALQAHAEACGVELPAAPKPKPVSPPRKPRPEPVEATVVEAPSPTTILDDFAALKASLEVTR